MREVVPAVLSGERVDRVVSLLTGLARSKVAALVADGRVFVDGAPASRAQRLEEGQEVELADEFVPEEGVEIAEPLQPDDSVEFPVVHEDDWLIVIDKPAGLVVHPGAGNLASTLVHGLTARYPEIASVGDPARPGLVHRLDKGTSGLMVVARTQAAFENLSAQVRARSMSRRYLALVWGLVEADRGLIDAPIGRSDRSPLRQAVSSGGREARTRYEVRGRWSAPDRSLVECYLDTGRMHQIRVHLAAIGHALVGDPGYRGARQGFGEALGRPFLHAWRLGFRHPEDNRQRAFASPLPPDLADLLPEEVDLPSEM
ncbi:MAG TPA: RluA family pseudouridine synthase [Acidimicrobiales bacterium]|nr:RluA family pseudouridine synthase [Acidimicrobiales bacterium]